MIGDWEIKNLDDLCTIKGRIGYRGYTKQDLVKKGVGAITLSPSNIIDNKLHFENCTYISWDKYYESPEIMVNPGDIIYCKTASIGKMALVDHLPEKATLNPQFVVLKDIACLNKFLYYYMISEEFKHQAQNITGGTAVPTLSQKNLGNLKIPVPAPYEQQQIVAILDKALAAIDQAKANVERNLENAKELFQSKLNEVFSQKGEGWEQQELGCVSKIMYGYTAKTQQADGIKYLRITDIQEKSVQWDSVPSCNINSDEYSKYKLQTGDIVFARTGATTGKSFLLYDPPESVFASYLIRVQLQNSNILPGFLYLYFQTSYYWNKINEGIAGSAQGGFNASKLSKLVVPFPSEIQQTKIIKFMQEIESSNMKMQEYYISKLRALDELQKSILQKAFNGELKTTEA